MNEFQSDNHPSPYRRGPSAWIVFVGTLSFFVGLNLLPLYFTLDHLDGHRSAYAGFPQPYVWYGGNPPTAKFDPVMLLFDLAIAVGLSMFLERRMRHGWREFWHWLRTAGVRYASEEERQM